MVDKTSQNIAEFFKTALTHESFVTLSKHDESASHLGTYLGRLFYAGESSAAQKKLQHACLSPEVAVIWNAFLNEKNATSAVIKKYFDQVAAISYPLFFNEEGQLHNYLIAAINLSDQDLYQKLCTEYAADSINKAIFYSYVTRYVPDAEYIKKHNLPNPPHIDLDKPESQKIFEASNAGYYQKIGLAQEEFSKNLDLKQYVQDLEDQFQQAVALVLKQLEDQLAVYKNMKKWSITSNEVIEKFTAGYDKINGYLAELSQAKSNKTLTETLLIEKKMQVLYEFSGIAMHQLNIKGAALMKEHSEKSYSIGQLKLAFDLQRENIGEKIAGKLFTRDQFAECFNTTDMKFEDVKWPTIKQHTSWFFQLLELLGLHVKTNTEALLQTVHTHHQQLKPR